MAGTTNSRLELSRTRLIALALGMAVVLAGAVGLWAVFQNEPAVEKVVAPPSAETVASAPPAVTVPTLPQTTACDTSRLTTPSDLPIDWAWRVNEKLCLGYGHPADWTIYQTLTNESVGVEFFHAPFGNITFGLPGKTQITTSGTYSMFEHRPDGHDLTMDKIRLLEKVTIGRLEARLLPTVLVPSSPGTESWSTGAFVIMPDDYVMTVEMESGTTFWDEKSQQQDGMKKADAEQLFLQILMTFKT